MEGMQPKTEEERVALYNELVARGLSDSEARGTAWPERTPASTGLAKEEEKWIDPFLDSEDEGDLDDDDFDDDEDDLEDSDLDDDESEEFDH